MSGAEYLIRETLERRGEVIVSNELMHSMCGVHVCRETRPDGQVAAAFVGDLAAMQSLGERNGWAFTPRADFTAAITRAP